MCLNTLCDAFVGQQIVHKVSDPLWKSPTDQEMFSDDDNDILFDVFLVKGTCSRILLGL